MRTIQMAAAAVALSMAGCRGVPCEARWQPGTLLMTCAAALAHDGVARPDHVILTHAHQDHTGG